MQQGNGGIIGPANNPTNSVASGVWGLNEQAKAKAANNWPTAVGAYEIQRSLRFNSADSAYLSRTPSVAGNQTKWTFSAWIKRSALSGTTQTFFYSDGTSDTTYFWIGFNGSEQLACGNWSAVLLATTQVFRDVSSWYHVSVVLDTSQATATDRIKFYVNNTQVTAFATNNLAAQISQNEQCGINNTVPHNLGRDAYIGGRFYFNGYLTEVNFIDGQALDPTSFGETDTGTGVWKPKQYTGSYGTNGFYLPFNDNSSVLNLGRNRIPFDKDPDWQQTVLLLNGDGANGAQNNTFLDSSSNNFTITRNPGTGPNAPTQGTFSPFSLAAGEWSNFFDGNGDYLQYQSNAAFEFGTGNFTIEFWWYPQTLSTTQPLVYHTNDIGVTGVGEFAIVYNTSLGLRFYINAGATTIDQGSTSGWSANQWYHVAAVRNGNTLTIYRNGVSIASGSVTGVTIGAAVVTQVGGQSYDPLYSTGYISNYRVVKGRAVYTSAFTPPTVPLGATSGGTNPPQGTETSLLTCQSNRFVDNGGLVTPNTITRNGDVRVTPFSPFAPTAAYDPAVNGGSGYFDGTGDYLTAGSNSAYSFGTGAYTMEAWVYFDNCFVASSDNEFPVILCNEDVGGGIGILATSSSISLFKRGTAGSVVSGSITVTNNAWHHIVVSRSSTSANATSIFFNGVRIGNGTDNNNWTVTGPLNIGRINATGYYLKGYLSNLRLVKGTAVYDPSQTTLTIPTSPLTAITNTSLLLNFTNAGIVDQTGKNVLETVGNVQVDTAVKKFGTGSLEFDGTGDYLVAPSSSELTLNADFTIEGWAYVNASGNYRFLTLGDSASATGIEIYFGNGSWLVYSNNATRITGSAVVREVWIHLAVVRSGSTVTLYVNGSASGSTWSSSASFSGRLFVGAEFYNNSLLADTNGFIDDLRISKVAKYTGNFSVPDAPFALTTVDNNYRQWVPTNFSVTPGAGNDSLVDSPTPYGTDTGVGGEVRGNYATLNPLNKTSAVTLTNGSLDVTNTASGSERAFSTISMKSGKWYCEFTSTSTALYNHVGIYADSISTTTDTNRVIWRQDGPVYRDGSQIATITSFTNGDVIGMTFDADTRALTFYKNGVLAGGPYTATDPGAGNGFYYHILMGSNSGCSGSFNFGQRPFAYTAPSGFKALCTTNLPEPTVVQGDDHFNTVLWTGTSSSGGSVTGVGFQPDLVWLKNRGGTSWHHLVDVVRTPPNTLFSNQTSAETTPANGYVSALNTDGFSYTAGTDFNSQSLVAWNWKANGAGVSNTAGSITATVSANTTAGVSIVAYAAQSSGTATIGHGLGVAPSMIILKSRASTYDWAVYHVSLGNTAAIRLNTTGAANTSSAWWNNTSPTSTVFTVGTNYAGAGNTIAYCFAAVPGFSAFGSYTGNGSADGPFIYTGFRPAFVIYKRTDAADTFGWIMTDNKRDALNPAKLYLGANTNAVEGTASGNSLLDYLSNGFKFRFAGPDGNVSGGTYIYAAFAENPFKYSLAR